jgi:hypothetical protein
MSDEIIELNGTGSPVGRIRVRLDIELPHEQAMAILGIVHDHKEEARKAAEAEAKRQAAERRKAEAEARKAAKAEAAKAKKAGGGKGEPAASGDAAAGKAK